MVCDTLLSDNVTYSHKSPVESQKGTSAIPVLTKNIVPIDYIDFFATAIVRSLYENYRPTRPFHPTRTAPKPRLLAPRNSGTAPATGHGKPNAA